MRNTPNSSDYVWEKMHSAVSSMCGKGSLGERLANAGLNLHTIEDIDLPEGRLRQELKYVLDWTKRNRANNGNAFKLPDDVQLQALIEKMLHILLETHIAD